jgi:large subunit ribosomal protein L24
MQKSKIKKDDQVVVLSGKNRGARGRVLRVMPSKGTAVVEGVNMIKRHTKPNPQRQSKGGIVEREAPVSISCLMVICPETGTPTRVGRRRLEDGTAVRYAKKSNATLN